MSRIVTLIIDLRAQLSTVEEALAISDVWLVESEENGRISGTIWSHSADFKNTLSTFQVSLPHDLEDIMIVALELIDCHHNDFTDKGDWEELRVIGVSPSELSDSFLSENQLRIATRHPDSVVIEQMR